MSRRWPLTLMLVVALGLSACSKPLDRLQDLNGCYEGEGSPDFMRPAVHWAFQIKDGVLFDRAGNEVSKARLLGSTPGMSSLAFSPGILLSDNEHKELAIFHGDTTVGKAYLSGSRVKILISDWVMQKTSCGPVNNLPTGPRSSAG